jgi:hypothetical protein
MYSHGFSNTISSQEGSIKVQITYKFDAIASFACLTSLAQPQACIEWLDNLNTHMSEQEIIHRQKSAKSKKKTAHVEEVKPSESTEQVVGEVKPSESTEQVVGEVKQSESTEQVVGEVKQSESTPQRLRPALHDQAERTGAFILDEQFFRLWGKYVLADLKNQLETEGEHQQRLVTALNLIKQSRSRDKNVAQQEAEAAQQKSDSAQQKVLFDQAKTQARQILLNELNTSSTSLSEEIKTAMDISAEAAIDIPTLMHTNEAANIAIAAYGTLFHCFMYMILCPIKLRVPKLANDLRNYNNKAFRLYDFPQLSADRPIEPEVEASSRPRRSRSKVWARWLALWSPSSQHTSQIKYTTALTLDTIRESQIAGIAKIMLTGLMPDGIVTLSDWFFHCISTYSETTFNLNTAKFLFTVYPVVLRGKTKDEQTKFLSSLTNKSWDAVATTTLSAEEIESTEPPRDETKKNIWACNSRIRVFGFVGSDFDFSSLEIDKSIISSPNISTHNNKGKKRQSGNKQEKFTSKKSKPKTITIEAQGIYLAEKMQEDDVSSKYYVQSSWWEKYMATKYQEYFKLDPETSQPYETVAAHHNKYFKAHKIYHWQDVTDTDISEIQEQCAIDYDVREWPLMLDKEIPWKADWSEGKVSYDVGLAHTSEFLARQETILRQSSSDTEKQVQIAKLKQQTLKAVKNGTKDHSINASLVGMSVLVSSCLGQVVKDILQSAQSHLFEKLRDKLKVQSKDEAFPYQRCPSQVITEQAAAFKDNSEYRLKVAQRADPESNACKHASHAHCNCTLIDLLSSTGYSLPSDSAKELNFRIPAGTAEDEPHATLVLTVDEHKKLDFHCDTAIILPEFFNISDENNSVEQNHLVFLLHPLSVLGQINHGSEDESNTKLCYSVNKSAWEAAKKKHTNKKTKMYLPLDAATIRSYNYYSEKKATKSDKVKFTQNDELLLFLDDAENTVRSQSQKTFCGLCAGKLPTPEACPVSLLFPSSLHKCSDSNITCTQFQEKFPSTSNIYFHASCVEKLHQSDEFRTWLSSTAVLNLFKKMYRPETKKPQWLEFFTTKITALSASDIESNLGYVQPADRNVTDTVPIIPSQQSQVDDEKQIADPLNPTETINLSLSQSEMTRENFVKDNSPKYGDFFKETPGRHTSSSFSFKSLQDEWCSQFPSSPRQVDQTFSVFVLNATRDGSCLFGCFDAFLGTTWFNYDQNGTTLKKEAEVLARNINYIPPHSRRAKDEIVPKTLALTSVQELTCMMAYDLVAEKTNEVSHSLVHLLPWIASADYLYDQEVVNSIIEQKLTLASFIQNRYKNIFLSSFNLKICDVLGQHTSSYSEIAHFVSTTENKVRVVLTHGVGGSVEQEDELAQCKAQFRVIDPYVTNVIMTGAFLRFLTSKGWDIQTLCLYSISQEGTDVSNLVECLKLFAESSEHSLAMAQWKEYSSLNFDHPQFTQGVNSTVKYECFVAWINVNPDEKFEWDDTTEKTWESIVSLNNHFDPVVLGITVEAEQIQEQDLKKIAYFHIPLSGTFKDQMFISMVPVEMLNTKEKHLNIWSSFRQATIGHQTTVFDTVIVQQHSDSAMSLSLQQTQDKLEKGPSYKQFVYENHLQSFGTGFHHQYVLIRDVVTDKRYALKIYCADNQRYTGGEHEIEFLDQFLMIYYDQLENIKSIIKKLPAAYHHSRLDDDNMDALLTAFLLPWEKLTDKDEIERGRKMTMMFPRPSGSLPPMLFSYRSSSVLTMLQILSEAEYANLVANHYTFTEIKNLKVTSFKVNMVRKMCITLKIWQDTFGSMFVHSNLKPGNFICTFQNEKQIQSYIKSSREMSIDSFLTNIGDLLYTSLNDFDMAQFQFKQRSKFPHQLEQNVQNEYPPSTLNLPYDPTLNGSPFYAPPERFAYPLPQAVPANESTDIYSLAMTIVTTLVGLNAVTEFIQGTGKACMNRQHHWQFRAAYLKILFMREHREYIEEILGARAYTALEGMAYFSPAYRLESDYAPSIDRVRCLSFEIFTRLISGQQVDMQEDYQKILDRLDKAMSLDHVFEDYGLSVELEIDSEQPRGPLMTKLQPALFTGGPMDPEAVSKAKTQLQQHHITVSRKNSAGIVDLSHEENKQDDQSEQQDQSMEDDDSEVTDPDLEDAPRSRRASERRKTSKKNTEATVIDDRMTDEPMTLTAEISTKNARGKNAKAKANEPNPEETSTKNTRGKNAKATADKPTAETSTKNTGGKNTKAAADNPQPEETEKKKRNKK